MTQFGTAVAVSGDTVVVGAWLDDDNGTNSGAAYVFDRVNGIWSQSAKIVGSATTAGDHFGHSLDIDGDTIVIAARHDDPSGSASGAAYVFERNQGGAGQWGQVAQLTASDGAAFDRFANAVSIDADTVVVGAHHADEPVGGNAGAVYVFGRDSGGPANWGETQKITPGDLAANDQFGFSVAIDGDQLAVGSRLDDYSGTPFRSNSGSMSVFQYDSIGGSWEELAKVYADDPGAGDRLGSSLSFDNGVIVAGAPFADRGAFSDVGVAIVFQQDSATGSFVQLRELADPSGKKSDEFGGAVSVSGVEAIIGARRGDSATVNNIGTSHQLNLTITRAFVKVDVLPTGSSFAPPRQQALAKLRMGEVHARAADYHDLAIDLLSVRDERAVRNDP